MNLLSLFQAPTMRNGIPLQPAGKVIPPPGMALAPADKTALTEGLAALMIKMDALKKHPLWPDLEIYRKAVAWSLEANTIYNARELATAKELLVEGTARAEALAKGAAPWTKQTGLVVRGYVSKLDSSIQPYGVVVPENAFDGQKHRLDLFLHGRGENLTELSFLEQRRKSGGEFIPPGALVLHPYGRFCNANHLAGEVDVFEAIAHVQSQYKIDEERIILRGFSMGGGATWHLAVHHPDFWCAAAPGAGFADTIRFSKLNESEIPGWQRKLIRLYDPVDWAVNLAQCPLVVYSGEIDGQKLAADDMEAALKAEGLPMTHIIGPKTGHSYHKDSKPLINTELDKYVTQGLQRNPHKVRLTTYSLRYAKSNWLQLTGLEKHWERARAEAERSSDGKSVTIKTSGVSALELAQGFKTVTLDGQTLSGAKFYKEGKLWKSGEPRGKDLRKKPGLQGPIDDAFMERFVFVRPTGIAKNPAQGLWAKAAMEQAVADWKQFFRGEVVIVDDDKVTGEQIRNANLIVWGDPASNKFLGKLAAKLPLGWTNDTAPVFIYPNPLNPSKYVVVNSGFTWHDYMSGSNAHHTPKLPDWAVVRVADSSVKDQGFFDESWKK
jgi:dienelactone hydrolase